MVKTNVSRQLGQWHEFAQRFSNVGGTFTHLQKVIDSKNLAMDIVRLIETKTGIEHVIDTDQLPFCESGSVIKEHKGNGKFKFDPQQLSFYLSNDQKDKGYIKGEFLAEEVKNLVCANATVLDYLLEFPHLIPQEWFLNPKGDNPHALVYISFWGTIYEDKDGMYVRALTSENGTLVQSSNEIKGGWRITSPTLIFNS